MQIRVKKVSFGVTDCVTRLPFRFGMNTMTWAPTLTARVEVECDAGRHVGYSADLLVPKWFEKDPKKSLQKDIEGLMHSAVFAGDVALHPGADAQGETVFQLWWRLYCERVHGRPSDAPDRLLRGFGVALVERAVIDATCRAANLSFFDALKTDLFAVQPGLVYPELADWSLPGSLPKAPSSSVALRHTIGLVDVLRTQDLSAETGPADGLPEALEQDITAFGLHWFKLKLSGDRSVDLPRTLAFAELVAEQVQGEAQITVDGNEQFSELTELRAFLEELRADSRGRFLLNSLVCIEQPLPRALSLLDETRAGLLELDAIAPVILDEADHGIEALPRAIELGYRGVSMKNCKGVLRALLHRGLCERSERAGCFQSGEDLTNLGVLALQQDLATGSALGLEHVERNGHHYFRGLTHLSTAEMQSALTEHATLWSPEKETAALRIDAGRLDLSSLQGVGYGYAAEIDWGARTPLEEWRFQGGPHKSTPRSPR